MLWRGSAESYPLQTIGQFVELVGDIQQPPSALRAHKLSLPSKASGAPDAARR
jgi:hypothetical protein